ncbi:hypothetical protein BDZ91DRAFT_227361 [Kalaharituber pfeilii]|nr:hypothetical protein BDZ91DRAFT_227361 [Kalaharituber pfeilii]
MSSIDRPSQRCAIYCRMCSVKRYRDTLHQAEFDRYGRRLQRGVAKRAILHVEARAVG